MLDVYRELIAVFGRESVRYAVFKGHDHLAEDLGGDRGDVDVWVDGVDMDRAVELAKKHGFFTVRWESSRRSAFFLVGWDLATGRRASLHVHRTPFARHKRTVVPLVFLYRRPIEIGGVDAVSGATLTTAEWTQRFVADKAALLARSTFALAIGGMFRARRIRDIGFTLSWMETARTFRALVTSIVRFRGRAPVARRGLIVAISGVDGSGKSTLIDTLEASPFLKTTQGVVRRYFGNRDFWMPGLARAVRRPSGSRLGAALVLALSIADRKLRAVSALSARNRGRVVLCDRYYFDHRVGDPTAKYLKAGRVKRFADSVVRWVPVRPDLAIYLKVSAATAQGRKPEKSLAEFRQVIAGYDEVFAQWAGTVEIDAERTADEVAAAVRAAIATSLRRKGRRP